MNKTVTDELKNKKASEVARRYQLGDAGKKLLSPELTAEQYVTLLIQHRQYLEAIRFLAFALSAPLAIRWANNCARVYAGPDPPDKISAALGAVDTWLGAPTDENRRAALKAAEQAEFGTPAGSAALAVFFSGGSMAPAGMPDVLPDQTVAPNTIAGAVLLAAVLKEPEKADEKYQVFLAEGLKIAAS